MGAQNGTETLWKLRPLGALEKYMVARSELGIYYKVAVTAVYARKKHAKPLKRALFHALKKTILAHPILSAIPVATDGPAPYFAQLQSIDLTRVVTFADMAQAQLAGGVPMIDAFLEQEHNRPFQCTDPPSPFWRLYVFADNTDGSDFMLTFFFHHCIVDTIGALVFHESLEAALLDQHDGEPSTIVIPPHVALPPALDDFLGDTTAPSYAAQSSRTGGSSSCGEWSGAVQFLPVKTRFRSHWMSTDTTQRLLNTGKAKNVSLTATLQSMLAAAIFRQLSPEHTKIKVDCAMSLRPWLPRSIHPRTLGVFVDNFSVAYDRGPFCWMDAVTAKHMISRTVAAGRGDGLCGYLGGVADMTAWLQAKLGHARPSALELSNVGKMAPFSGSKEFEIRSLLFSQSAGACSGAVKVSAATGRDGRLALGFSWQEGVLEGVSVEQLIRDFESIVREALLSTQDTSV